MKHESHANSRREYKEMIHQDTHHREIGMIIIRRISPIFLRRTELQRCRTQTNGSSSYFSRLCVRFLRHTHIISTFPLPPGASLEGVELEVQRAIEGVGWCVLLNSAIWFSIVPHVFN
jgi:hypothetical protein